MRLSTEQLLALHTALLSAFSSRGALRKMLLLQLGENLEAITLGGNLSEDVIELMVWAQTQGRVAELIAAGRADNPGNEELRAFAEVFKAANTTQDTSANSMWSNPVVQAQRELLLELL